MRTFILLAAFSFTLAFSTNAQLTISAKAGWNNTAVHLVKTQQAYKYKSQQGWQTGLQAGYALKNWMLYTGLQVDKRYFNYNESDDGKTGRFYKPTFFTLPLGLGYNYALTKNFGLRFYTGLYVSTGVGGKYYSRSDQSLTYPPYMCDPGACPETFNIEDRKIRYGNQTANSTPADLKATNWGTQFGLGILAWRQVELLCMYDLGLSNILPSGITGEDHRLRSISIDLKVNVATFNKSAKK